MLTDTRLVEVVAVSKENSWTWKAHLSDLAETVTGAASRLDAIVSVRVTKTEDAPTVNLTDSDELPVAWAPTLTVSFAGADQPVRLPVEDPNDKLQPGLAAAFNQAVLDASIER